MSKQLARLLRADIQETSDLKSIAKTLANKGRGNDTILAHITPKEVKLLKEAGGAGTVNPDTGLLEFYDWSNYESGTNYDSSSAPASSGGYYDSLPAATQGVYGSGGLNDYYQMDPNTSFTYPLQSAQDIFDSGYTAPVSVPTVNAPVGSGAASADAASQGMIPPNLTEGVPRNATDAYMAGQALYGTRPGEAALMEKTGERAVPSSDSLLKKYVGDPLAALKASTGLGAADLLRVGGAGAGAIVGRQQAKKAAEQIQQATQEQKNVGQPYQKAGQDLQRAAMAGELTPQGAQAYQAMRAQMAQGVESRGGVGVAQAQAQVEAFRQQLLANQYNLGLQVSQIGDNIALGAIRTGMQLDQQLAQANQQFYTQLAALAGGGTYGYNPQQVRGTP